TLVGSESPGAPLFNRAPKISCDLLRFATGMLLLRIALLWQREQNRETKIRDISLGIFIFFCFFETGPHWARIGGGRSTSVPPERKTALFCEVIYTPTSQKHFTLCRIHNLKRLHLNLPDGDSCAKDSPPNPRACCGLRAVEMARLAACSGLEAVGQRRSLWRPRQAALSLIFIEKRGGNDGRKTTSLYQLCLRRRGSGTGH